MTVDDGWQQVVQYAENVAAQELERIGFGIPLINRGALNFVLDRSYEMSSFTTVFMADHDFGYFKSNVVNEPSVLLWLQPSSGPYRSFCNAYMNVTGLSSHCATSAWVEAE